MQAPPLIMSEEEEALQGMILHASSLIAAAKGLIKIRAAMRMVGFTEEQTKSMTLYQKVRRKSQNMIVVDKKALTTPSVPEQIGDGAETVSSTLSSADRNDQVSAANTNSGTSTGNNTSASTSAATTLATPRRLLASTSAAAAKRSGESLVSETETKKFRRSSTEVQREQANVIMKTKKDAAAMKLATVRIQQNKELPVGHPDRKSINVIVAAVNVLCDSNISPKTAAAYVRNGLIDLSPKKRGPCGEFSKAIFAALKGAYSTFLMLEQAECKKQSSIKDMALRVNACVNTAGHTRSRDDLTRKLRKETSDLFTVGKANMMEQRRLQWTTHHNLDLWFTTFKSTLIELGFGREPTAEDVEVVGEVVFFDNQKERIVNLDETDGTLDEANRNRGGRPPMVFTSPDLSSGGTAANKSGYSSTIICGSNAAGEALPPHFQLKSLAQQDCTQRISVDWFLHAATVVGKFGFDEPKELPTTFGLNEKGGMNTIELDKHIKKAILPLYPDVADVPGKRVLLKVDSGPGRMNVEMLASLRLQGVYLSPGVPNTTHVTQETDQNYGLYKSLYRSNLRVLAEARQARRKTIAVSDLPLLVFGGYDYITKCRLENAFERAFSQERNLACWKKCGAVPLTRFPLQSLQVRHELTYEGTTESKQTEQLKDLAALNHFHCDVLSTNGYYGGSLRKEAPKMKKKLPAVTLPQTKERIKAIRNAKASGQLFHATGGQHLNSDDFFQARALIEREESVSKFEKKKKNMLLLLDLDKEARSLLARKGPFTLETSQGRAYSKADIKLLCKWKKAKMGKINGKVPDKKSDLAELYFNTPDPPAPEPWTEDDEELLQSLKEEEVPLESTQLGVAARQMAVATANNMEKLDKNTRNQLLKSIADFDMAEQAASRVNAD